MSKKSYFYYRSDNFSGISFSNRNKRAGVPARLPAVFLLLDYALMLFKLQLIRISNHSAWNRMSNCSGIKDRY